VICISSVAYYLNNREGDFDKRKTIEFFVDASLVAITVVALFILIWLFEIHNLVMCWNFLFILVVKP
jgi:hypothetical protein